MKVHTKIIVKLVTLLSLVVLFSLIIHYMIYNQLTSYYWGAPLITDKHEAFIQDKARINTLFMGSSKVLFHISPTNFDEEINQHISGYNIHSFNYGIPAMFPMESFILYEKMLEHGDLDNLDFVFLELSEIHNPKLHNLHKRRLVYWLDWKNYIQTLRVNWSSVKRPMIRYSNIITYSISFAENLLNVGFAHEVSNYLTKYEARGYEFSRNKWDDNRGFIGLPAADTTRLQKLSQEIERHKKLSLNYFAKYSDTPVKNIPLQKKVLSLLEKSKKKGINLVFLLTTRTKTYQYEELIPIIQTLPEENKIIMCNAHEVPDFFEVKYLFDKDHLNNFGARLFTQELSVRFNDILREDRILTKTLSSVE